MNALQIPFFSKCEDTFGVRVLYNVASGYSSSAGWPFSLLDGPFPVVFTSCTTLPNPASLTAHVSRCKGWYTPHRNQLSKYLAAPSLTSLGLIGRDRRHKKKYEKHREGFIFHICSGEQNVRVCTSVPLVMKAASRKPGKTVQNRPQQPSPS